jgi:hypothetical protein
MSTAITVCVKGREYAARAHYANDTHEVAVIVDAPCDYCGVNPLRIRGRGELARTTHYYISHDGLTLCCGGIVEWMRAEFDTDDVPVDVRRLVRKANEPMIGKAGMAIKDGRFEDAAQLYDFVAKAYREARLPTEGENWARRARDCREVSRRQEKERNRER